MTAKFGLGTFQETNIASASTCDIGPISTSFVVITGTTAITSFGTRAKCWKRGRFAGSLTLTHNGTSLILPTGANIITAAGDTFEALSDASGNWRVTRYTLASGKALVAPAFSAVSGKPTTLSGYGITDAGALAGNNVWTGTQDWRQSAAAAAVTWNFNNSATAAANVEARIDLSPGGTLTGQRSAYISAINEGSNIVRLALGASGASGAPPAERAYIKAGVVVGAPTGADKGAGTLNATAVYDDNVLLTCAALQDEFLQSGTVDLAWWDAQVPDRVTPEERHTVDVMETVEIDDAWLEHKDGHAVLHEGRRRVERQKMKPMVVHHPNGKPVMLDDGQGGKRAATIGVPETRVVVTPERREKRRHATAHLFKGMLDEGFDPRDPLAYVERLERDHALPGMPIAADWEHGKFSLGEIASRKWLAMEFLALAFRGLLQRHLALEARVGALEGKA